MSADQGNQSHPCSDDCRRCDGRSGLAAGLSTAPVGCIFGVFFPAQWIVVMAAGGPIDAGGETYTTVLTALLAILIWYALIEVARRWWPNRRKRVHSSNA